MRSSLKCISLVGITLPSHKRRGSLPLPFNRSNTRSVAREGPQPAKRTSLRLPIVRRHGCLLRPSLELFFSRLCAEEHPSFWRFDMHVAFVANHRQTISVLSQAFGKFLVGGLVHDGG